MSVLTGRRGLDEAVRRLIAADARFIGDMTRSLDGTTPTARVVLALGLSAHASRVVFEGVGAARTGTVAEAAQRLVDKLPNVNSDITVRTRHASKLSAGLGEDEPRLETLLLTYTDLHRRYFQGRVPGLRRLLPDASRFQVGQVEFGMSVAAHFQFGASPAVGLGDLAVLLGREAQQQGRVLSVLAGLDGVGMGDRGAVPLEVLGDGTLQDVRLQQYLLRRTGDLPLARQLLLLLIEGQVNFAAHALRPAAGLHPGPVLRARYLTLVHVLQELRSMELDPVRSALTGRLTAVVHAPESVGLLEDKEARDLRNRLMHYWIRNTNLRLRTDAPLLGLVEAVRPGWRWEDMDAVTQRLLGHLSAAFVG